MTTFNGLSTMNLPTEQQGDGLPRIWWHNGAKGSKGQPGTPGDFYTKAEFFDGDLSGDGSPWKADTRFNDEPGFAAERLCFLVIHQRLQWYIDHQLTNGQKRTEWLPKYQDGARGRTEILCIAEGIDGAVVLSVKGTTGRALNQKPSKDGAGGVIPQFRKAVIDLAGRKFRRTLPLYAFWLPISTKRTAKGDIAFEDTGFGSFVTPPALALPADANGDGLLDILYPGDEMVQQAAEFWRQYEAWPRELRGNAPVEGETEAPTEEPAAPPRNIPQALTDDDLPY
jgi:hypothetical protein